MSRTSVLNDGVWPRAARFLAAVLLFGGLGAGPLAHLAADAGLAAAAMCEADAERGDPGHIPDAHHDCPVCVTLATATPSVLPTIPSALPAETVAAPAPGWALEDAPAADLPRARAPPIA
jgi:hypothetical protein